MPARKEMENKLPGGRCRTCQQPLAIGERIVWIAREDGKRGGRAYHPACEPDETRPQDEPTPIVADDAAEEEATPANVPTSDAVRIVTDRGIMDADTFYRDVIAPRTSVPTTHTSEPAHTTHTVIVEQRDTPTATIDNAHPLTALVLNALTSDPRCVYLYGDPGGGKSYVAAQLAKVLNVPFYSLSLSPMSMPSLLMGYMDAHGKYSTSAFRMAYENGGVLCIDECDNTNGNLLATMNDALANGACGFPDGMVRMHPKFYVIGTGNTPGYGGTDAFPDRRALDTAFRDRFKFIEWTYDRDHERAVAWAMDSENIDAIDAWVSWVHAVRTFAQANCPEIHATPRAIYSAVPLLGRLNVATVANMVLFKGCDVAMRERVLSACPLPSIEAAS